MSCRLIGLTLLIIIWWFPTAVWSETIVLVADEWPPYNSRPNAPKEGYLVDIARAVFESRGITVSYRLTPWKRAIELTRNGKFNAVIGA